MKNLFMVMLLLLLLGMALTLGGYDWCGSGYHVSAQQTALSHTIMVVPLTL